MSGGIYDLIPGLKEAEEKYKAAQAEAFIGLEPSICGVMIVNPFTPQMFVELEYANNAFLQARVPEVADVAAFLWRISPIYKRDANEVRLGFLTVINELSYEQCALEILAYLDRSWHGMPQWVSRKKTRRGSGHWLAALVHTFASNYGWHEEYIFNLPFRRLWQYVNRIIEANDDKYSEKCPEAVRLQAKWLQEQNRLN